jgi:transposase-like protein
VADYDELKQQAIQLRQQGFSLAQIARQLGLNHSGTISRWVAHVPFTTHNAQSRQEQLAGFRDPATYERARELRRAGWSYSMITAELGVNQSTLSGWIRDVEIEDHSIIEGRIREGRESSARTHIARHQANAESVYNAAIEEISEMFADGMTQRELFLTGLVLYWAEGGKTQNLVALTNADPMVIKTFLRWVRESLGITDDCLRAEVHCYPDTDITRVETYWSEITKIPLDQFYKTQIDTRTNKSLDKQGKLEYGTVQIKVLGEGSSNLHRKIIAWIQGLGLNIDKNTRE